MQRGVYQLNMRGLTFGEAWRFSKHNPWVFLVCLVLKLISFKSVKCWVPEHEGEEYCREEELSPYTREQLTPHLEEARSLGYVDCRFSRMAINLDPDVVDTGGCYALHEDGMRALGILCVVRKEGPLKKPLVCTTGFLSPESGADVHFLNHANFMDSGSLIRRKHVKGERLADIDAAMQQHLNSTRSTPRKFRDVDAMLEHMHVVDNKAMEGKIKRGLYRFVSSEVEPHQE